MSETPNAAPQEPQLEGSLFLFSKPELLSKEKHAGLGMTLPAKPFGFCADIRAVPLTVTEIGQAQKHYPIIFSEEANPLPLAVLGLIDDVNLFVDDEGQWEKGVYIPAYIRRYPFAFAGDQQSNRMALVLDTGYDGITKDSETPFFAGDELSEATKAAMEFCTNYERDRQMTMAFSQQLATFGLISNQMAQFTADGDDTPRPFAQYAGVDEKKLNELPEDKFLALRKNNMLPILYAQLMSMGNWRTMMDRRVKRFDLSREDILKPLPKK